MPKRLSAILVVILLAASCAYGSAIRKGDDAYAAKDWETALLHYEAALARKPDSPEAAQKVQSAKEQLVGSAGAKARAALKSGDIIGAMDAARDAWDRLPEAEATRSIIRDVSNHTFAKAQELEEERDYANAMMLYQSLGATLPSEEAKTTPRAEAVRERWIASLENTAAKAEEASRPGDALLAWAKLAQLTGDPTHGGKRDQLRRQILADYTYLVVVNGKTSPGYSAVTAGLEKQPSTNALQISLKPPSGAAIDAEVKLQVPRVEFRTDRSTRTESVQYQSGTRQVENPFYKSRQDDLLREQQRLVDYENDVTRYENDVSRYEEQVAREGDTPGTSTGAEQNLSRARSSLESARRKVQDQRNQVQRAREELARTEPTTEEAVYSTHQFTVTTETLIASTSIAVTIEHADGRPALKSTIPVETAASDETHGAQSIAGVAEDPLTLPSRAALGADLHRAARDVVRQRIDKSFQGWRSALVESAVTAPTDDERVNLYGIYIVTDPANISPKVPADISAMRGIPDAVKILTQ